MRFRFRLVGVVRPRSVAAASVSDLFREAHGLRGHKKLPVAKNWLGESRSGQDAENWWVSLSCDRIDPDKQSVFLGKGGLSQKAHASLIQCWKTCPMDEFTQYNSFCFDS